MITNTQKYQRQAHGFAVCGSSFHYPFLGLSGEAGEVCELLAKFERKNHRTPLLGYALQYAEKQGQDVSLDKEFVARLESELGDVMWMVAEIATCFGLTLDGIMEHNIKKLSERKQTGTICGSGETVEDRKENDVRAENENHACKDRTVVRGFAEDDHR